MSISTLSVSSSSTAAPCAALVAVPEAPSSCSRLLCSASMRSCSRLSASATGSQLLGTFLGSTGGRLPCCSRAAALEDGREKGLRFARMPNRELGSRSKPISVGRAVSISSPYSNPRREKDLPIATISVMRASRACLCSRVSPTGYTAGPSRNTTFSSRYGRSLGRV